MSPLRFFRELPKSERHALALEVGYTTPYLTWALREKPAELPLKVVEAICLYSNGRVTTSDFMREEK